jgi:hypothetical protein
MKTVKTSLYEPSLTLLLKNPTILGDINNRLTFMKGLLALSDEHEKAYLVHREIHNSIIEVVTPKGL